jgi:hypothetical protein
MPPDWSMTDGGLEIVWRVLEGGTLLLVLVRRTAPAVGLASGFLPLIRFVRFLARNRHGLRLACVVGMVDTFPYRSQGGLDDSRLQRFYVDVEGAEVVAPDAVPGLSPLERSLQMQAGTRWVRMDLERFLLPRRRRPRLGPEPGPQ